MIRNARVFWAFTTTKIILLFILILSVLPLRADINTKRRTLPLVLYDVYNLDTTYTTGAEFLKISIGARPSSMGEAFVAVCDETSGMFWNPAGLGLMLSPEIQVMHSLWLGDLYYSFLGCSYPCQIGVFGFGARYVYGPQITKIVDEYTRSCSFYYDAAADIVYARRIIETLTMGTSLRYIQSKLNEHNISAFTGDIGVLFHMPSNGLSVGLSGQNLFNQTGQDELPLGYKIGLAFKTNLPKDSSDILLSVETGKTTGGPLYYAAGAEHWFANIVALRLGYKYYTENKPIQDDSTLDPWRVGVGFRIKNYAVDYAYQSFASLGATHRVSLTWRLFGWHAKHRIVSTKIKAEPAVFSPNSDGIKDTVFFVPQVKEIKDITYWELNIKDINNNPIRKFSGDDVLPKIISWEGNTELGGRIDEGKYRYAFAVKGDRSKRARSGVGAILADLTMPDVSLSISKNLLSPNNDGLMDSVTFYISATDNHRIEIWQIDVLNEEQQSVRIFKSSTSETTYIIWDGRDEHYGAIVPNGDYEVKLTAWDVAGNKNSVTSDIKVYTPPKAEINKTDKEVAINHDKRGLVINLSSNMLYGPGKSKLKHEANKPLDDVISIINANPENKILIEGHTDSTGSVEQNLAISKDRAWAVYSYFVKHGIEPSRLEVKGWGQEKPISPNNTIEGRMQNRRIEIIILKEVQ